MQAASRGGGGGGGRHRQALQMGDVLPCHLMQQPESPVDPAGSNQEVNADRNLPDKPSSDAPVGPAAAAAEAQQPAVAAPAPAAPASPGSPAVSTEPLPAYTSLARQQLQQRLKAAIAAGTGAAAAAATAAAAASLAQQRSSSLGPSAVQQPRRKSRAGQLQGCGGTAGTASLPLPDSRAVAPQRFAALPLAHAQPAVAAGAPAAAQDFQLPLPGRLCQAATAALLSAQAQQQQGVQRGPLALLLPPLTEQFTDFMPARLQGADGATRLLVLPSDGPSSRQEALTAVAALEQLLSDPAGAAQRAAAWREQSLLQSSSAALLGMTAGYVPQQHARQLRQADGGQAAAGGSCSSPLAGPAWLAGNGSTNERASISCVGEAVQSERSCGSQPSPVNAVRSSSSFLQQSSSPSRSGSPLPPLVLPRVPSRLGGSTAAAAAAAAAAAVVAAGQTDDEPVGSSLQALPAAAVLGSAHQTRPAAALPAQLPPPLQQRPAPPTQQDPAWEAYCQASVAAALTVCMAEAVRQVEVGCAERGRLLAQLWNRYTATLGAVVRQQQGQVDELLVANANLSAEASQLRWEASRVEFLRKEINRLRKDKESVSIQLEDCQQELGAVQADLSAAAEQQEEVETHLRRRLAALRWRWAAAAVLLPRRHGQAQLGCTGTLAAIHSAGNALVQQMLGVEAAAAAVVQVRQQLREQQQQGRAEAALAAALAAPANFGTSGSSSSSSMQSAPARQHVPSRLGTGTGRSGSGGSGSGSRAGPSLGQPQPLPLACLRPEARAAVLLSLPAAQRQQALAGMSDAERAAVVLHWEEATRAQVFAELGPALAAATDAAIWRKPLLLARLLSGLPADQAAAQLRSRATAQQQAAVLEAMPPQQAAALLLGQPAAVQQQLLVSMPPRGAAALIEWVQPATALPLLLAAASCEAANAVSSNQSKASDAQQSVAGSWAAVLPLLPERQAAAMLTLAQPAEAATLLDALETQQQARLLLQLPPGPRAAAQVVLQQLRATAARQRAAAEAGQPAPGTASEPAPGGSEAPEADAADAPPTLDAATSLLALFEQLSPADKTALLLMGSPGVAAPLLLHLQDSELSDVMLLLPPQRQEALLLALHPLHEQRVLGVMRQAARRRCSLLLPQHVTAEASADSQQLGGQDDAAEGSLAGEFLRIRRASSFALPPTALRRASSLSLQPADGRSAAAPGAGMPALPGSAAGRQRQGSRRGSLLALAHHAASQQRRDSRCASSLS